MLAAGGSACPTNYSKIMDEATCKAAAVSVGQRYDMNESKATFPRGCYFWATFKSVYLNVHSVGGNDKDPNFQLLCAGARRPLRTA